ncbi:lipid droplet-associated hydrolase [Nymphalis io]|uniref:lipid droplet-associated hydrolase n=1 Tax=Inachis io TaxID=171585 RepID=UPI0021695A2F|nr:lipid droplet-associated hydrolase [Nymphalis io]
MKRISKILNNVQSNILTWGNPFSDNGQDVVICITGNPGLTEFYIDFGSELYRSLQLPVCVLGHAGHEGNCYNKSNESKNDLTLFDLQGQLQHKLDFIENHVSQTSKIHLVGHSIGAWMIIELLQKNDKLMDKVLSVNLLFPTLQRMAESRNGIFVNNVFRKFNWFILFLCKLLYVLPTLVFRYIVYLYLMATSMPYYYCDTIMQLVDPSVIEKVFFMAFDEMDTVKKLNREGLNKIKHMTNVIYGNKDNWAPLEYMEDIKKYQPYIQMTETHNIEHAFVIKSSECVADMVASFIKSKGIKKS